MDIQKIFGECTEKEALLIEKLLRSFQEKGFTFHIEGEMYYLSKKGQKTRKRKLSFLKDLAKAIKN